MRIFLYCAWVLLVSAAMADVAIARPQPSYGNTYIYPDGTIAYYVGLNSYRSNYYVIPPVNGGYYGPSSYNGMPGYRYPALVYPNQYNNNGYSSDADLRNPRWYQWDYGR